MQYHQPVSLPQPDEQSARHSARVVEHLRDRIRRSGDAISFAEFMHEALYATGLGYYAAGSAKFGRDGDFVTAPEISPLFGRILARQCEQLLRQSSVKEVLEIGAGSGRLAVDMLTAFAALDAMPAAYSILEVSAELQQRQLELLQSEVPHLADVVRWLPGLPNNFEGVIVANEVLDALPVERIHRRREGVFQCCVTIDGDDFAWDERPANERLVAAVKAIEMDIGATLDDGYVTEIPLAAKSWVGEVAASLKHGAVLLFDYGVSRREYYAADRSAGWLRCHFRHYAHSDPLRLPGIQDITAWVDFSAIAGAAVASDLDILAYTTQAHFLLAGGLAAETQGLPELAAKPRLELSAQIKRLTLPGEMGENFKCMALARGDIEAPSAFHLTDRTRTL